MAEVGWASVIARTKARLHALEVRRASAESRRAVAVARSRRARRLRRPVTTGHIPVRLTACAEPHDWSTPVENSVVLSRGEAAMVQASSLRHDAFVLRGAVSWQLRRLRKTRAERRLDKNSQLTGDWIDSTDGLDDLVE